MIVVGDEGLEELDDDIRLPIIDVVTSFTSWSISIINVNQISNYIMNFKMKFYILYAGRWQKYPKSSGLFHWTWKKSVKIGAFF